MKTFKAILWTVLAVVSLSVSMVWASPVSPEQARQTALDFIGQNVSIKATLKAEDLNLVYPTPDPAAKTPAQASCYIFNIAGNGGFVVISGDDDLRPVLGYSFSGSFPAEQLPANLRHWIEFYENQVETYQNQVKNGGGRSADKAAMPRTDAAATVAPLLENYEEGAINFDQTEPYNNLCPNPENRTEPTVTGCVATAMTQIARYHKHPARGEGSVSYTTEQLGIYINHDFSESTYDWENMLCDYNDNPDSYTQTQKNAVALLMRDIGYASLMDYGYSESAAYDLDALYGMQNYMGYSRHSEVLYRDYYTEGQWLDILTAELEAGRPMYYSGSKQSGGGHAFVCDGYNEEMYFHFNWGWGSWGNGWYWVENLLPNRSGTGAGEGSGGYDYDQCITVNLQPSQGETDIRGALYYSDYGHMDGTNALKAKTGQFTQNYDLWFTAYDFYNLSPYTLEFDLAITYWKDDEFVKAVSVEENQSLDVYYGWENLRFKDVHPGTDVEPGTYKVCLAARYFDRTLWEPVKAPIGYTSAYRIEVSENGYSVEAWSEGKVENPVINPNGGVFEQSITVAITCASEEASLYYSLDETRPSTPYTGEFTLTESTVVRAMAVMPNGETSEIVRAVFTLLSDDCENTTISETFKNGFGTFHAVNVAGDAVWNSDVTYGAKITGYNTEGNNEDYLVSSSMDLYNMKSAVASFSHAVNYAPTQSLLKNGQTCWVSTDYNGDVKTATWQQVEISDYPAGTDWTFVNATVDFSAYCGEPYVVLAFKYIDDKNEGSPTWEIKDLEIELVCKENEPVSVRPEGTMEAKVYPNPSDGLFVVEVPTACTAEVYTENGMGAARYVWPESGTYTVNLRGKPAGIYYLRLTAVGSTGEKTVKLVVR